MIDLPKKIVEELKNESLEYQINRIRGAVERAFESRFNLPKPNILATFSDHVVAVVEDRLIRVPFKINKKGGLKVSDPDSFENIDYKSKVSEEKLSIKKVVSKAVEGFVVGGNKDDLEKSVSELLKLSVYERNGFFPESPEKIIKIKSERISFLLEQIRSFDDKMGSIVRVFEAGDGNFSILYETDVSDMDKEPFRATILSTVSENRKWLEDLLSVGINNRSQEEDDDVDFKDLSGTILEIAEETKELMKSVSKSLIEVSKLARIVDDCSRIRNLIDFLIRDGMIERRE